MLENLNMNSLDTYSEEKIERILRKANEMYREGHPMLTDDDFDLIVEELEKRNPNNPFLADVGYVIQNDRTEKLPYTMGSLNKNKSCTDLFKICNRYNIPLNTNIIITPKFDGISLLVNELNGNCWTRGNGIDGNRSDVHFNMLNTEQLNINNFTIGEVIMSNTNFKKFKDIYANPRNLVAGSFNQKLPYKAKRELKNIDFIRYGIVNTTLDKCDMLDLLNSKQSIQVPYKILQINELTDASLKSIYTEWNVNYSLDGLVIDINDYVLRSQLGRDTNNNPKFAFAFKGNFEEQIDVPVKSIRYQISRRGKLTPVLEFTPVSLSGVMISNATGYNAKYLKDNDIGVGTIVTIKRSGEVIPSVVKIVKPTMFVEPTEFGKVQWSETGVDLFVLGENDERTIQQIMNFYKILQFDDVGYGFFKTMYFNGINTLDKTLKVLSNVLLTMDGIGESKSNKFLSQINELKNNGVSKSQLMAATGFFPLLGQRKLRLLEHFEYKPTLTEITSIKGFSDKTAGVFLDNYDNFIKFAHRNSLRFEIKDLAVGGLTGQKFIFTGFRNKELELEIISNGGEIVKTIKSDVIVITKDVNGSSSKLKKAKKLKCKIISLNDFKI